MNMLEAHRQLKDAIRSGQPVLGLFVRTPAVQVVEVLGQSGADCIVLDAEHAPFGAAELDHCILAGRSVGLPVLVRLGEPRPANILQVLDMGAAGIIVPHVGDARTVAAAINACHYKNGTRGFSGQHRAANYGAISGAEYREASDESIIVIAQIEDSVGHANVAEIAAVSDLDAIFVGRADLAVSMGCDGVDDARVVTASTDILAAGSNANMTTGIFLASPGEMGPFRKQGASLFMIATDQSLLLDAARDVATEFMAASGRTQ